MENFHLKRDVNGAVYAGMHIIVDLYGVDSDYDYAEICLEAARRGEATILFNYEHRFGEGSGKTGVIILGESHISYHTWPEVKFVSIDIFMCGESNPEAALEYVLETVKHEKAVINRIQRGNCLGNYCT